MYELMYRMSIRFRRQSCYNYVIFRPWLVGRPSGRRAILNGTAGKSIFAGKPLGMGACDRWEMARAVEQAGGLFQTGYFMRTLPAIPRSTW